MGDGVPATIGIDETWLWRREPWLTCVVDLTNSDLFDVARDTWSRDVPARRSATTCLGSQTSRRPMYRTVVIDLHAGHRAAVHEVLPLAVIVGDRFHFEQRTGQALTDARRRQIWEQLSHRGRKTIRDGGPATTCSATRPGSDERLESCDQGDTHRRRRNLDGELLWAWAARQ